MQVSEQVHQPAYFEETDAAHRTAEFANAAYEIPTDSLAQMPPVDAELDAKLAFRAHCCRLENPRPEKVCLCFSFDFSFRGTLQDNSRCSCCSAFP